MANADLRSQSALGYVTELLSGDYLAPSAARRTTRSGRRRWWRRPLVRGLLGLSVGDGGRELLFAPQLPADWDRVAVGNVPAGGGQVDLTLARSIGQDTIVLERRSRSDGPRRALLAPAYPLDARIEVGHGERPGG